MAVENAEQKKHPETQRINHCELDAVHIQIGKHGEINAWGLDQDAEEVILERTGNKKLAEQQRKMSYTFCG